MLTNFLRSRRKQKLLEELETNSSPSAETFVELVQYYREDGDYQTASKIAKRGAEFHPESEKVLQSRSDMERVIRDLEKERLRQKIQSYPNPILYARLAELYKVDGQVEAAIHVCQAGISSFPSYGGTYLVLGEICMESGDLAGARVHLEKAVELDKYNYTALKLLAGVYMQLEMPDRAARRLEEILYFAPGDESIMAILREARVAAGEPPPGEEDATAEIVDGGVRAGGEEPVAAVIEEGAQGDTSKAVSREEDIDDAIRLLTTLRGVSGALLVDAYGLVIAGDIQGDLDEELVGAMITNIFRAVTRSAEEGGEALPQASIARTR